MANIDLNKARSAEKNEFMTREEEIVQEFKAGNYSKFFEGKSILCPCNDRNSSAFSNFFYRNFDVLQLKEMVCVSYGDNAYKIRKDNHGTHKEFLLGNGDFSSPECKKFMESADIICTNPPFSLFSPFINQCLDMEKDFLVIGNINDVTINRVFNGIKSNKIFLGPSIHSGDRPFYVPDSYPFEAATFGVDENKRRYVRVKGVRWFTNLPIDINVQPINLTAEYHGHEDAYPKYENLDAIEVSKTKNIPKDFPGLMGVPVTFLDKYCPSQFEILGFDKDFTEDKKRTKLKTPDGIKTLYARIIIQNKRV